MRYPVAKIIEYWKQRRKNRENPIQSAVIWSRQVQKIDGTLQSGIKKANIFFTYFLQFYVMLIFQKIPTGVVSSNWLPA